MCVDVTYQSFFDEEFSRQNKFPWSHRERLTEEELKEYLQWLKDRVDFYIRLLKDDFEENPNRVDCGPDPAGPLPPPGPPPAPVPVPPLGGEGPPDSA